MSGFKEITVIEKNRETDSPKMKETEASRLPSDAEARSTPFSDFSDIFAAAFKRFGITSETVEKKPSVANDYSDYIEKVDNGKYRDKITDKIYDSVKEWMKFQEIKAKRAECAAKYWEKRAGEDYAEYKKAKANGDTEKAKQWYLHSQYCYKMAEKWKKREIKYRERLGSKEAGQNDENSESDLKSEKDNEVSEKNKPIKNKIDGSAREDEVSEELEEKYPPQKGYEIIFEAYLLDKNGNKVGDPKTKEARRIDIVVVKDGKVIDVVEVTSKTADKTAQSAKENRIRESGGNYVRDNYGNLVEIPSSIQTRIERKD